MSRQRKRKQMADLASPAMLTPPSTYTMFKPTNNPHPFVQEIFEIEIDELSEEVTEEQPQQAYR